MKSGLLGFALVVLATAHATGVEIDAPRLFTDLDANADGRLDADEVGTERARLFARLVRTSDDDGDGQLTADEFAAGLTPVRAEKALVEKLGSRLPGGDALVVMLAKLDANGDRRLVADEIPAQLRGVFETMLERGDADQNGRLETREIAQAGPQLGIVAQLAAARLGIDVPAELARLPQAQRQAMEQMDAYPRPGEMMADPEQASELFARLDANGDKRLAADEAPEGVAPMIRRGDRDGDGQLSEREFLQMSRRMAEFQQAPADPAEIRRGVRQLLNRFDRNGDGALDADEAPRRLAANFERLDQDASGSLEGDELQQAAAAFARLQRSGRERPRPAAESEEQMQQ